jgi:hypothetical protein
VNSRRTFIGSMTGGPFSTTLRTLGVTIPPSLLLRADEIIQ